VSKFAAPMFQDWVNFSQFCLHKCIIFCVFIDFV
jgi:hypothetical protein